MNEDKTGIRVGIDLGTTNSLVAHLGPGGAAEVLPSRDQEPFTPSVVSLARRKPGGAEPTEAYVVGRQAANMAKLAPESTIRSIKRFIGLPFKDSRVQVAKEHVTYEVLTDPKGSGAVVARLGDRTLTAEEVSALVLRRLKEDAEARLGAPVTHAVVTVPAHFEEHRRVATHQAGVLAGLTVLGILDEPTAAAISESDGRDDNARTLVFDFGGGTLDISLVVRSRGNLNVRNYTGDTFLGGDDIDRGLAYLLLDRIVELGGEVKANDLRLAETLRSEAESAKRTLASGQMSANVMMPAVCRKKDGDWLDLDTEISQQDFSRVLAPLEERVRVIMRKFFESEALEPRQVTEVLMVGGTSAVDRFRQLLQEIFESDGVKRVKLSRSPMEAVAKGAALYAARLRGLRCTCGHESPMDARTCQNEKCGANLALARPEMQVSPGGGGAVQQTLPRSLGVGYRRGDDTDAYQRILKKGSVYPIVTPVTETFQLPSTERFQILIREGDAAKASENALIGVLTVQEIPADVKRGDPLVVGFSYTRDRMLFVSLHYPTSKMPVGATGLRWQLDPPDGTTGTGDDPSRALTELVSQARSFADEYERFMDTGERKAFQDLLRRAQDMVCAQDKGGAEKLMRGLTASMFQGCGTASTLYMAERTIAQEDEQLGRIIQETAVKLREQHQQRSPEKEKTRMGLEKAIMKALERRMGGPVGERLVDTIFRGAQ